MKRVYETQLPIIYTLIQKFLYVLLKVVANTHVRGGERRIHEKNYNWVNHKYSIVTCDQRKYK